MKVSHIDQRKHLVISSGITLFALLLLLLIFFLVEFSDKHSGSAPRTDAALAIQFSGSENESRINTSHVRAGSSAQNIAVADNAGTSIVRTIQRYRSGTSNATDAKESELLPVSGNNNPGEDGTTTGIENPGINFNLSSRALIYAPKIISDTKEQGKVVVDILVNQAGIVIEANPNGRGTTTSSPSLKKKAGELALLMKFNSDKRFEEQKGTITIVFAFD